MSPTQTNALRGLIQLANGEVPRPTAEQRRLMNAHRWGSHPQEDHPECPFCIICRKY